MDRTWSKPSLFCEVASKEVKESSGIASSLSKRDTYYTHNDSGDSARFFRFGIEGRLDVFELKGVQARDWEDMASVRLGKRNWLYFADVGDNGRSRKEVRVHRLEEPQGIGRTIEKIETFTLKYPDDPRNCEAFIVDPRSGDFYLVTKEDGPSWVYTAASPKASQTTLLKKLGSLKVDTGMGKFGRYVTAGDADRAGKHVVLRTYSGALEYTVTGRFQDWWKSKPASVNVPLTGQAEAVCYAPDGQTIVTTSEGSPCQVHVIKLAK